MRDFLRRIFGGGRRQTTFGPGPGQTVLGTGVVAPPQWPPQAPPVGSPAPQFPGSSSISSVMPYQAPTPPKSVMSSVQNIFAPRGQMAQSSPIFDRPSYSPPPVSSFLKDEKDGKDERSIGGRAWDFISKPEIAAGIASGIFGAVEGRQSRRSQERQSREALAQRQAELEAQSALRGRELDLQEARQLAELAQIRRENELQDQARARRARVAQMLAPMFQDLVRRQSGQAR